MKKISNKMKIVSIFCMLCTISLASNNITNNVSKTQIQIENSVEQNVKKEYSLDFDVNSNYEVRTGEINGKKFTYRAYENIVYVKNPVDIKYQTVNIYIPEEYFKGESIGNYNAKTAPIFFPNSVGGYMPGAASIPGKGRGGAKIDASLTALSKGYVVVAPGARGRTLKDENGNYTGKAPAAIVDLKAAVRYLKYNDKNMPGNANKIISNGTSAGGALSALLGATGNSKDYEPYLKELGAAKGKDDVFAVSSYCPITMLDYANEAYEWMYNELDTYTKLEVSMLDYNVQRKYVTTKMTEAEKEISKELKNRFPEIVNSLNLKDENGKTLSLNADGDGSFKELMKKYYIESANKALKKGTDLSGLTYLTIKNNEVIDLNFEEYSKAMGRIKTAGAFDNVDLSTGENNLFGDKNVDNKHYTQFMLNKSTVNGQMADKKIVKMMNPLNYIGESGAKVSKNWRIRHGAQDKDTAIAIPAILALKLENKGYNVDFFSPWGQGHGGDYDLEELFSWIDKVVAEK